MSWSDYARDNRSQLGLAMETTVHAYLSDYAFEVRCNEYLMPEKVARLILIEQCGTRWETWLVEAGWQVGQEFEVSGDIFIKRVQ